MHEIEKTQKLLPHFENYNSCMIEKFALLPRRYDCLRKYVICNIIKSFTKEDYCTKERADCVIDLS